MIIGCPTLPQRFDTQVTNMTFLEIVKIKRELNKYKKIKP